MANPPISNPLQEQQQQQPHITSVSVKIPPFWKSNPALWFCQIEAQFESNRIVSDKTKYNTVVASLESAILDHVSDLVLNPPRDNLYATLKTKILERFADSEQTRLRRLLNDMSLGDKKPSHLLREMKSLAGQNFSDALLKSLWLQHLPSQVQAILTISEENTDILSTMADKIHEVSKIEVCSTTVNNKIEGNFDLSNKIEALTKQIAELSHERSKSRSRFSRFRSNSNSRQHSQSRSQSNDKRFCWYHFKFGDKAAKCIKPCSFDDSSSKN